MATVLRFKDAPHSWRRWAADQPVKRVVCLSAGWLILSLGSSWPADRLQVEEAKLPPLRIDNQPAQVHTQGLEVVAEQFYVTGRRDDILPRRALLLRTDLNCSNWDVWDITPFDDISGEPSTLDHPGGMQSDGARLWIPVAESRRNGKSLIRVFRLEGLIPGVLLKPELEYAVDDHIGAIAVSRDANIVLGASWDTETVYLWDCKGRLQRTIKGPELRAWRLGLPPAGTAGFGLAVQDWKILGGEVFACGLLRGERVSRPVSRLFVLKGLFTGPSLEKSVRLPGKGGTELGREAMAIDNDVVYFLPEDLGSSNRLFRISLSELQGRSALGG